MTGGTGFVGQYLAGRLVEDGHSITCLVRNEGVPGAAYLRGLGAELVPGNVLDAGSIEAGARGAEAVIHLVGIIFERPEASFEQVHVKGTRNAIAAAAAGGGRRFLHMSALGARPGAPTAYLRTKWEAEEAVRASGLDYTIFRPSVIYGPGGEFISMLARMVRRSPVVPVIGNGEYCLQPVSVLDVAACFSLSLGKERAVNQIYELGGPAAMTYNEMILALCGVMGKKRRLVHVPVGLVRAAAAMMEKTSRLPLVTRDQIRMLLEDSVCDISRMRAELGVSPVGFRDGVVESLG